MKNSILLNKFTNTQLDMFQSCFEHNYTHVSGSGVGATEKDMTEYRNTIINSKEAVLVMVDTMIDNSDHILVKEELGYLKAILNTMTLDDINLLISLMPFDTSMNV